MDKSIQKLFFITQNKRAIRARETQFLNEKELQNLVEGNLMELLGLHLVKPEHSQKISRAKQNTKKRFDTLGLTQRGHPAIIEYKKKRDKNALRQLISYLDNLDFYRSDFELLVERSSLLTKVRWDSIRTICIAEGFEEADISYVRHCTHTVELVTYRYFHNDTLLFEWVYGEPPNDHKVVPPPAPSPPASRPPSGNATFDELVNYFRSTVQEIGPEITPHTTKHYKGYKKNGKIFLTFCVYPQAKYIRVWLPLDPTKEKVDGKNLKDMRNTRHHGLGDLEILIDHEGIVSRYAYLLHKSYNRFGASSTTNIAEVKQPKSRKLQQGAMSKALEKSDFLRQQVFNSLCSKIMQIDSAGIERFEMKHYFIFKKDGKVFAFIRAYPQLKVICCTLNLNPSEEKLDGKVVKEGNIGGCGRVRIELGSESDLEDTFYLIEKAYRKR